MPRFLAPVASLFAATLLLTLLSGCERPVASCAEFDPPPGKQPTACPPKPAAAIQAQPALPARYCYSSLAQVDCYGEPQPGRTGYMGSTEAPPPSETPVKAKSEKAEAGGKAKPTTTQTTTTTTQTAVPAAAPAPAQPASPPAPATTAPTPLKPAN
jgi:hypothetical protein